MIITEIYGGLGNQLFEYAHTKALSIKLNKEVFFDLSFFDKYHIKNVYRLNKFDTNVNVVETKYINKLKRKTITPNIVRWGLKKLGASGFYSKKNHFDEHWFENNDFSKLNKKKDLYISGYFADEKYFIEIEDIIRKEFTLKKPLNIENEKVLSQIKNSNSISIHIRRGDYVKNSFFAQIPLSYYRKAVDYMENNSPNSSYFIFSDDITWVKENLKIEQKTIFVDINDATTDYMELMLMASCKHNIIANSTFSWWGAWLNNNSEKIIIAPKIWFGNTEAQAKYKNGNLVPSTWKKI